MVNFNYKYAVLSLEFGGVCVEIQDTTNYILDPSYVPIEDDSINYLMKYYHPIPSEVTCFADFQGLFYLDAAHTQPFEEGNAALRHEE